MKKVFQAVVFIMLATVFNMSVSSCSSDDYSSPIKGKTVNDVTFESSQSTNSITIGDADLTGFTVTSSESWCVATAQGKNLNITVQPNTTYGERQATIMVTDPGDQSVVSFKILQKQNDAILIDGKTFNVPEAGGDVTVKVQSNVKYQLEIPSSASWLTSKAATRALENSTIVLSATANNSGDEREATVKLTNTASGVSSQFTVKQELTPAVTIDTDEFQMDEFGGEVEVTVTSNIAIDVKFSDDWLSSAGTTEKGNFSFVQKIKIDKLTGSESSRTANVVFTDKLGKWDIKKTVTIKQTKSLLIQDDDIEINVGDSYSLKLINNIGGNVKWSSSNTSIATVDNDGIVKGVGGGTATITVTSADGKYSDKVNVTVKASLSIQENDIEILLGKSYTLTAVNKTGSTLSWKSSNPTVATVNSNGKVTGISKGSATITVTSADGKFSAQCSVSVKDITNFIKASLSYGSLLQMLGNLIQYGSKLNCDFFNKSSETVRLKSLQLVDGVTGYEGNIMSVNKDVPAGKSVGYTITIGLLGIHTPVTCRFRYEYNGKEYMTTDVFNYSPW